MIRDDHHIVAVNDRFRPVKGQVRVLDRETGRDAFSGEFEVQANATADLGVIQWEGQGLFLIDATVDGEELRNYYLYGAPPFDFMRFDPLLRQARARQ